ncbi:4-hydroxy-3-methylbut-2-enyl diphosphate reductase [Gammaproteobacteria bacterium]|nr:4-hydroxy-3-methylbut-2-enyl diphosphate reductase [Gammaproteobacteria bacterium]
MTDFLIKLANPRGFCAGVDRAIEIVERALQKYGAPVYVRHEVVHNRFVVDGLRSKGAIFIEELDEVPEGAILIFSAHGVSRQVQNNANVRGLKVFDATCPLVTKVHSEVARYGDEGKTVILVGHQGHPEVEGTMGQAVGPVLLVETLADVATLKIPSNVQLAYVTQTTLSVDDTARIIEALRRRFPEIEGPRRDDICYATQNRQDSVGKLAQTCDVVLVVGSHNSSNSNRLRELAEEVGARAYLIDDANDIVVDWLIGVQQVGITAGASAPEVLVSKVINHLETLGGQLEGTDKMIEEGIAFALPAELRKDFDVIVR